MCATAQGQCLEYLVYITLPRPQIRSFWHLIFAFELEFLQNVVLEKKLQYITLHPFCIMHSLVYGSRCKLATKNGMAQFHCGKGGFFVLFW